ncbi:hypothetical protein QCA50_006277 [Cerrena zonata]|uniref:Uncharacterized protein n=1 Tax=Cerrena zonata TaxID=2478898 RepID=A0AAW0GJ40_9APHY
MPPLSSIIRSPSSLYLNITMNKLRSRSPSRDQNATTPTETAAPLPGNPPQPNASLAELGGITAPRKELKLEAMSPLDESEWRYNRTCLQSEGTKDIDTIKRMTLSLRRRVPDGWEDCEHPEGKLYYRHPVKRILTHLDINNAQNLIDIDRMYEAIRRQLDIGETAPMPYDVVIDIQCNGGNTEYCYYLFSWEDRAIMWAEDVSIYLFTRYQRNVYCEAHLNHAMTWHFWLHVEMFPNHIKISRDMLNEVSSALAYGWNDVTTSETSTVPLDPQKISELLRIIAAIPKDTESNYHAIIVARSMVTLSKERFYNYHGQPIARLTCIDTVDKKHIHNPRSLLFLLFSPFFFWMPDIYLAELERIWVDQTVNYHHWNKFFAEISQDWKDAITPATVLLTANVGFLAIQSIDQDRPLGQVASYISTLFSSASYIVCQVLARQHRIMMERSDSSSVAAYLSDKSNLTYGLELPAFAYSLPMAFFSWGMLTFLLSILHTCFYNTSSGIRIATGIVFGFLTVVIGVVLYMDWGVNPFTHPTIRGTICATIKNRISDIAKSLWTMWVSRRKKESESPV